MPPVDSLLSGYEAITHGSGVVDRSERGKLALTGRDAKAFLQGQVTNDIEGLTPGTGCYAAVLTPKAKMLADVRILDAGEEILLDTERAALQELFNMIRRFSIGFDVELHKRTLQRGLLSVIGPRAAAVTGVPELGDAPEHAHLAATVLGVEARAIRTDVGIDLLCDANDTGTLRAALAAGGAPAVDEAAGEILRVEHGRPRYGVDLDDTVIPQEAGLNERAVSFTKGCYVGQETVARLYYRGKPNRHLRGLRLSDAVATGAELLEGDRVVGRLTSVVHSPRLGWIGLGFVRREVPVGAPVAVRGGGSAEVAELPFNAGHELG